MLEEHTRMAIFCSRYLTSRPFQRGVAGADIRSFATSGYYGFQDYSVAFWNYHVDTILASHEDLSSAMVDDLVTSLSAFLHDYRITSNAEKRIPELRRILLAYREENSRGRLLERMSHVRSVIESIDILELDERQKQVFLQLNGIPSFKCPKTQCERFASGFLTMASRDSHLDDHDRPFKCSDEACPRRDIGYPTREALDKHREFHSENPYPTALFSTKRTRRVDIFAACISGDLEAVRDFVREEGVDVNEPRKSNRALTPLFLAMRAKRLNVCNYLITQGAKIWQIMPRLYQLERPGISDDLLHLAQMSPENERVALLADESLFHLNLSWASRTKNKGILQLLIRWNLDRTVPWSLEGVFYASLCMDGQGDADFAGCFHEMLDQISVALKKTNDRVTDAYTAVYETLRGSGKGKGHIMTLVGPDHEPSTNIGGDMDAGNLELNNDLVEARFLMRAISHKHLGTGIEWCCDSNNAMHEACAHNNVPAALCLIDRLGAKHLSAVNDKGETPLMIMLKRQGSLEIIERLVEADGGAAIQVHDSHGNWPLHVACRSSSGDATRILLAYAKGPLDYWDRFGRTPLNVAIAWNSYESMVLLLNTGSVSLRVPSSAGTSTLEGYVVLERDARDMLELLYQQRPLYSDIDHSQDDTLALAVKYKRWGCLSFLLSLPDAVDTVRLLLQGPDRMYRRKKFIQPLLGQAIKDRRFEIAKLILASSRGIVDWISDESKLALQEASGTDQDLMALCILTKIVDVYLWSLSNDEISSILHVINTAAYHDLLCTLDHDVSARLLTMPIDDTAKEILMGNMYQDRESARNESSLDMGYDRGGISLKGGNKTSFDDLYNALGDDTDGSDFYPG
jgi:ankyrin repeat protein